MSQFLLDTVLEAICGWTSLTRCSSGTHIDFSRSVPYEFAVTSSTRIQIFDPSTNEPRKTISRFKDVAYSGNYRSDGKLLVAGGEIPVVKLFDVTSKELLRWFKGHTGPVHLTKFSSNNIHVMSGSDDKTVRCWDLSTTHEILKLNGHEDYVRCGAVSENSSDVWVTGGYDHKVKVWDLRSHKSAVATFDTGFPVDSLLIFPAGSVVATASGNQLKLWDLLSGGKLLYSVSNHQKAITCLSLDSEGSRLISGGLDHHVKIYSTKDYSVTHSMTYSAPILSLALSPDDTHLCVGMSDGMLSIKTRAIRTHEIVQQRNKQDQLKGGAYRYFLRGKNSQASKEDFRVGQTRRAKLKTYEKWLRKFQYQAALDICLQHGNPLIIVSMIEELKDRDGLFRSLQGRNEKTLIPVLKFLVRYINDPKYTSLLLHLSNVVLDMYASVIGHSIQVDNLLRKLKTKVNEELQLQKQFLELLGALDLLLTASNCAKPAAAPTILPTQTSAESSMSTIEVA